ncbi:MAG: N-6 DNA methylase, partial [Candidatus Kapaibacterium sp.]
LENNLYGVDINEESVEIAKLSLWLRTAQKGRKLTSLNNNIKCGNSLIDDPEVAGDKAFNWEEEFPKVFAKGGFDVVIGNPPYGAKLEKDIQKWLTNRYIKGGSETAISFIKLGFEVLREYGRISYIIPKSFSFSSNYSSIREFMLNDLDEVIDCRKVWNEVKLEQVIFSCSKSIPNRYYNSLIRINENFVEVGEIDKSTFKLFCFLLNGISDSELSIGNKLVTSNMFLNDKATNSRGGIFQKHLKETGDFAVLGGAEIQRHGIVGIKGYVDSQIIENENKAKINNNSVLVQNIVAHIENPTDH